jgi:branched-chain amino acid transport system ATP-binding protein
VQWRVNSLTVHYGTAIAVDDVSLSVSRGSVVSVIGSNGAGKSTIMNAVAGLLKPTNGEIWFEEDRIDGLKPDKRVKLGIVYVPEGRRLFPYMSVENNLNLGAYLRSDKNGIKHDLEMVFGRFPILHQRRGQKAGTLSGGEQQMLAIGRALMAAPKLLLLDEPSVGLSPLMAQSIGDIISDINRAGISVLLVEQNAGLVFEVAKRGYVLEVGKVVLEGSIAELTNSSVLRKAFLG